jgi:hypothetical protein
VKVLSTAKQRDASGDQKDANGDQLGLWIRISPAVSVIAAFVYAVSDSFGKGSSFLSVLAVALAAAAAALITGVFLGFLFGLPRTVEQKSSTALLTTSGSLDQITDWLTKILVGLGLVQLGRISHGISRLASALAPGLGNTPGAKPFGTALLIYSAVDGFILGYLWARIRLNRPLNRAAWALVENIGATLQNAPTALPASPSVVAQATARELESPPPAPPDEPPPAPPEDPPPAPPDAPEAKGEP